MLDILARSIARAAGVETPDNLRIVEPSPPRPPILESLARAFERWNVRRSTWLTLREMDDRTLSDIGLHRGILYDVADDISRLVVANDNDIDLPVAHNLQRVFSGVNSDCLCTQFFKRFGNSVRMVPLIVNNQDYICLLLQIGTSSGLDR